MSKICEWFHHNGFKANPGKFHFLLSPFVDRSIKILESTTKVRKEEVLIGVRIDSDLTSKEHVRSICSKANQKLHALTRVSEYMSLQKRRILMKSFITSQFNYCPIVWMYNSWSLNNKVNHINERALRIVYQDFQSNFSALLVKNNSFAIHQKNLQLLAIEIFKVKINTSPEVINEIFDFSKTYAYELRCGNCLSRSKIHSTHFGIESITNIAAKIWHTIPNKIKEACSLTVFKNKIKKMSSRGFPL